MSSGDPIEAVSRGLPVVTALGSAFERSRVVAVGTIVSARVASFEERAPRALGFRCTVDDGTGRIDLLFVGRTVVPGLTIGVRCRVEGTARMDHGRLTLWNPRYSLESAGCREGPPRRSEHG